MRSYRYSALSRADEYRQAALDARNEGRGSTIRVIRTARADDPKAGSWERIAVECRLGFRGSMAEALEAFRFTCYPERYEAFV